MAETTTTMGPSRDASLTICATRPIHAASPTDVPPNFITRNGFFILEGSGAKQFEMPGAHGDRAFRMAAPQKTIHHRGKFAMGAEMACGAPVKALIGR